MPISASEFEYVCDLVRQRSAIVLEPGKEYLVEARLIAVAYQKGFSSVQDLVARLRAQPFNGLHQRVVEAMATNETAFFRDVHPFEALKQAVLPELLAKRAAERTLHLWSSACSSGQEPYSIAMLVREHFPTLANWTLRFLASDISSDVLWRAGEGRYSQLEVNRGLPAALLQKYFREQGREWQISADVRRLVEFRQINLAEPWPALPTMDIIFMRNVLIYFDVETRKAILGKVRRLLKADGYLFLGSAETTLNLDDAFAPLPFDKAACYRLRET